MPIDPRANSPVQLTAPAPLPHVSRRALRRVRDFLPPACTCPNCGTQVRLVNNSELYGREFGSWPYAYACADLSCYVGVHPDTDLPLGTLADKGLREARKRSKAAFQEVQRVMRWSRNEAYSWLAQAMKLPQAETHFGWFDHENCELARDTCNHFLKTRRAA